jgi:glycosyltransferase involved in cell wall biosynthesis
MSAAARESVQARFSWEVILDRLEEVYRRLAKR